MPLLVTAETSAVSRRLHVSVAQGFQRGVARRIGGHIADDRPGDFEHPPRVALFDVDDQREPLTGSVAA